MKRESEGEASRVVSRRKHIICTLTVILQRIVHARHRESLNTEFEQRRGRLGFMLGPRTDNAPPLMVWYVWHGTAWYG